MYALVMGGTEFVGRNLAKYLLSQRYTVDLFTRGIKPLTYQGVNSHLTGDRSHKEDLCRQLGSKQYDVVFDISAYTKMHVKNLLEVLDTAALKRYVFCSSGAVYTSTSSITSESAERGLTLSWGDYGLHKMQAEDYLLDLYQKKNLPVVLFRPTYIYGEENNLYRESFLFDRLAGELPIALPEGTATKTQFLHIDDFVRTLESAVHIPSAIGQAYNITHPEKVTWPALVQTAAKIVNKCPQIRLVPPVKLKKLQITVRDFFPFRDITYLLNIEKLVNSGLHVPQINLSQGLSRAYHWYVTTKPVFNNKGMEKLALLTDSLESNG
ncbi:MAG: epimerase [Firmicutes bacterium]|nr:epimerase [Bacillota bacterium]